MTKGRDWGRHKGKRKRPNKLNPDAYSIPCKGYEVSNIDGGYSDCGYGTGIFCEDCLVTGGNCDPRTGVTLGEETMRKLGRIG